MDKLKYHIVFFCSCFFFFSTGAQTVEVSLNRNNILIGQQISYGLKVTFPSNNFKANFSIPDSINHFDVIRKDEIKALKGETALEQVIIFTSFDSGSWYFPSIPVLITDGVKRKTFFSDSVLINVGYAPDSTNQIRDIKPVMDVHIPDYTIYYIIGGILLLLLLAYLIYRYLKNRRKKPVPLFNADLSPYQEAMKSLNELEDSNLLNTNKEKEYHTSLAGIFKRYYSRKTQKDMMNKTTGDILVELKQTETDSETISRVAEGLRYTDAVKFAKFLPLHSESDSAFNLIKQSIQALENKSSVKA